MYTLFLTIILNSSGQPTPSPLVFTQQGIQSNTQCYQVSQSIVANTKRNLPTGVRVKSIKTVCKYNGGN